MELWQSAVQPPRARPAQPGSRAAPRSGRWPRAPSRANKGGTFPGPGGSRCGTRARGAERSGPRACLPRPGRRRARRQRLPHTPIGRRARPGPPRPPAPIGLGPHSMGRASAAARPGARPGHSRVNAAPATLLERRGHPLPRGPPRCGAHRAAGDTGGSPGTARSAGREPLPGPVRLRHTARVRGTIGPRRHRDLPVQPRLSGREIPESRSPQHGTGRDFPSLLIPKPAAGAGRAAAEGWAPPPCPGRQQRCDSTAAPPLGSRPRSATRRQREPRGPHGVAARNGSVPVPGTSPPEGLWRAAEGHPSGAVPGCHRESGKAAREPSPHRGHPGTCSPFPERRHTRAMGTPPPPGTALPRRRLSRPGPTRPAAGGPGNGAEVAGPLALVRLLLRGLLPGEPHLQQLLGPFEEVCTALLHGETTRQPTTTEIKRQPNCRPRPPPFAAAAARAALLPPPGPSPSRAGFTFGGIRVRVIKKKIKKQKTEE